MSERILILTKGSQCTAKAEYSQLVCVASFYLPKNEDDKSSYYLLIFFLCTKKFQTTVLIESSQPPYKIGSERVGKFPKATQLENYGCS